jgi:hypothetical protein
MTNPAPTSIESTPPSPYRVIEASADTALPPELSSLKAETAGAASGYLTLGNPGDAEALRGGIRVGLFAADRCIAMGTVFPADTAPLARLTGLDAHDLGASVGLADIYIDPSARAQATPVLMYLLLRRARIWQRQTAVTYAETATLERDRPVLSWQPLSHLGALSPQQGAGARLPVGQRVDIAMHQACAAMGAAERNFVQRLFVPEAVETLEIHIERFFRTDFFNAVYESRLSREQYIYSMSNLHQFVRYTTRLIGRAVSLSTDEDLRNHWLNHLSGEINHEKIIEKDLEHLGADVDYVVHHMVPNMHNQQFMVVQESAIAFHQDPVLFMAAPFSAEGWTARLDQRFMDGLHRSVRSWGIEQPRHVTGFLSSHINYDGGDDGHWEGTRRILDRYLTSDQMLQRFLNLVHLAMNAFENSYSSYVTEQRLWSATPARVASRALSRERDALQSIGA